MACIDYGALAWKNGKILGKREDLFENPIDTLGFDIGPFPEGMDGYALVGNKNIVFSFYKNFVSVYDVKNNEIKHIHCEFAKSWNNGLHYCEHVMYKKKEYEIFGCKFTIKPFKPHSVFLFEIALDGDKYEVIFGYGIDHKWWVRHIPEIYDYNKKMLKFLNSHDNKNYQLNKKYAKNIG